MTVKRSEVVEHVVLMPMKIKTQWEGDKLVAVMPGWSLPAGGLMVEANNTADALEKLEHRMREYWGASSNASLTGGRHFGRHG